MYGFVECGFLIRVLIFEQFWTTEFLAEFITKAFPFLNYSYYRRLRSSFSSDRVVRIRLSIPTFQSDHSLSWYDSFVLHSFFRVVSLLRLLLSNEGEIKSGLPKIDNPGTVGRSGLCRSFNNPAIDSTCSGDSEIDRPAGKHSRCREPFPRRLFHWNLHQLLLPVLS